jgi:mono/diheme cytochrome c family protein
MKYQVIAILIILFTACGSGGQQQAEEETNEPQSMVQQETEPEAGTAVLNEAGKEVYERYCIVCHMANGQGVPSAFPPLTQTDYVNQDTDRLIGIVLNGLTGEIEVNGVVYNGVMTPHKDLLNDQEVADVLTYVRSSFGNDAPAVTAEQVAAIRAL